MVAQMCPAAVASLPVTRSPHFKVVGITRTLLRQDSKNPLNTSFLWSSRL